MIDDRLCYETNLINKVFLHFDDYIEEIEEHISNKCSFESLFTEGEFDGHFLTPVFDYIDLDEAKFILENSTKKVCDSSLWKDERDPEMQLVIQAAHTYRNDLYNAMEELYYELCNLYDFDYAEEPFDEVYESFKKDYI